MRRRRRRRKSRDEHQIGMRPQRDTVRDRSRDVPPVSFATPPLLTVRAVHVLTPTTMMVMVVPGLLQKVLGLQEVMMLIGRASKKRSELAGLSSFLLFLVLYAKRGENQRAQQLLDAMCSQLELHVISVESSLRQVESLRVAQNSNLCNNATYLTLFVSDMDMYLLCAQLSS